MKNIIWFFLSIIVLTQTTLAQSCPSGITNDPYPGQCGLYIDNNANNNCDLGEPVTNKTENHTQTDACDSWLAAGEISSTQMKAMTVQQLAQAFNINIKETIEKISTKVGFSVKETTSVQEIHDRANLPIKELRTLLKGTESNSITWNISTENIPATNNDIVLQQMHFWLFLGFLILLIVIFLTRKIKTPIFDKIRSIDANILLVYIPILGLIQYFFFPKLITEPIHRGYLWFRSLRLILIVRPLANITNKYIKKSILNTFLIWCVGKRKQIGITMFWFAFLHGSIWLINWLKRNMLMDNLFLSLSGIFWLLGLLAAGIGFITSNKKAMKYLGKNRKKIQKISYIAIITTTIHIYFINPQRWIIVIWLLVIRTILRFLTRKK